MRSAAAGGLYSAKRQIIDKAKTLPKTAGRGLRRASIGGFTGSAAALFALGAGASTGDPAKAAALAMAAGSAGYNFGNYYGDGLAKGVGSSLKSANAGFWGEDFKAVNQSKFDKEFIKSSETMNSLTQALGSTSEAKKAIDNGWVQAMLNNNITDTGKLAKATKLARDYIDKKKMSEPDALNRAIALAKMNRDVNPGIFNPMSRENAAFKQNTMKILKSQYGINIDEAQASKQIDALIEELQYFDM